MIILACQACCEDQITGWQADALVVAVCVLVLTVSMFLVFIMWDVIHGS